MAVRLTKKTLLAELRRLLSSPGLRIRVRKLHKCGTAEWTPGTTDIIIHLDTRRDGIIHLVIHELLHVYLQEHHNIRGIFSKAIEEAVVRSIEYELGHEVTRSVSAIDQWDRAIQRKIVGGSRAGR